MKLKEVSTILPALYIIISVFIFIKELSCHGWGCGYSLIIPILPWPLLLNPNWLPDSQIAYFIFILLNTVIIYYLVKTIEDWRKSRSKQN